MLKITSYRIHKLQDGSKAAYAKGIVTTTPDNYEEAVERAFTDCRTNHLTLIHCEPRVFNEKEVVLDLVFKQTENL